MRLKKIQDRFGHGMNPYTNSTNNEVGTINNVRHSIKAPPVPFEYLNYTKKLALRNLCLNFAMRSNKIFRMQQTRKDTDIQRWVNHSRINYHFGTFMIENYIKEKYVTVSQIVDVMYITRATARKLAGDWLSYGWAISKTKKADKRQVGIFMTDYVYQAYASYIEHQLKDIDYDKWQEVYHTYNNCVTEINKYKLKQDKNMDT